MPIPLPLRSGYTSTTATPLYWCQYGDRGSRLLVLHGGPGAHHDYLLPQMLELATRHRVTFYDQRGSGRSKSEDRAPAGARQHVEDVGAVAAELDLDPLILVGYSWGALLALLYALETGANPSLRAPVGLVLISPAPISRHFRRQFEAEFGRRQQGALVVGLREELASSGLRERDPDAYRQRAFELSVAGYFADPRRAHDLTPFRVVGRIQDEVWSSLGDFDLEPVLSELRIPALVLHGRHDPIPIESAQRLARALGAPCVVLEASGHVPYVEEPDALWAAVENFLRRIEPHS